MPCPLPGDLPNPGIEPRSPTLWADSLPSEATGKPIYIYIQSCDGSPSSALAWRVPWAEEPGGLLSMGSRRVGRNCTTSLSIFTFMHWRRKWHPTPVLLPGESQGRGSLVGGRLWGRTESDTTEATWQQEVCCCKTVLFGLYCKPKSNADVAHWLARLYWSAFWTQTFSKT